MLRDAYIEELLPFKTHVRDGRVRPVPEFIKELVARWDVISRTVDMAPDYVRKGWAEATHGLERDGLVRMELLRQRPERQRFARTVVDTVVDRYKSFLGQQGHLDEKSRRYLSQYAFGHTEDTLLQFLDEHRDRSQYALFEQLHMRRFVQTVRQRLEPYAFSHLKDEHLEDLLQYVEQGAFNKRVFHRDRIRVREAGRLVPLLQEYKTITPQLVQEAGIPDYALLARKLRSDAPGEYTR